MKKTLLAIIGPTAIGKTNLAISLAQHYKTEILSADSRQFFKEMNIGTAVPTEHELGLAKHHFIHHKSVKEFYTVGDFEKDSLDKLKTIFKNHDIAILVGGSGLYINAVLYGLNSFPQIDKEIREKLNKQFEEHGIESLQEHLKDIDPIYHEQVDLQNPQRIIRALEVSLGSGRPYSSFLTPKVKNRSFNSILIGITASRDIIYDRINKRVDQMIANGLADEVENLVPFRNLNALQTVGYKEFFNYLDGVYNKEFAIEEIKKNTRRFAKRQLSWFKKDTNCVWFDYQTNVDEIIKNIDLSITKSTI